LPYDGINRPRTLFGFASDRSAAGDLLVTRMQEGARQGRQRRPSMTWRSRMRSAVPGCGSGRAKKSPVRCSARSMLVASTSRRTDCVDGW